MIRSLSLAAALGGLMMTGGVASAMPLAAAAPAAPAVVQDVAWGCGPGWHPNPWGRCVPYGPVYYGGYGGWGWHHPVRYGWGWHRPWYGHWHH